jgi:hypothetical protein
VANDNMNFVIDHSYLIPLLPLIGAAAAGFFGARHLRQNSHWPIWIGVGCSAVLSIVLLVGMLGAWRDKAHAGHGGAPHAEAQPPHPDAESTAEAEVASADEDRPLYNAPTLAFRKYFYTWIRAGEREVPQVDAGGRLMFDASGE